MSRGDSMSCVKELGNQGYWVNEYERGFTCEKTRWGDAYYECGGEKCILVLKYNPYGIKRIKVKYSISINAVGSNPTAIYTCATGFGINRLILWLLDPMEKLFESMNMLIQLFVILQILNNVAGMIV